jgi:penicillin-binding protein 1C
MRRAVVAFGLVSLAAAMVGGGFVAQGALSRASLVSPPASEIVFDRNGAFITQIAHGRQENNKVDYGFWPLQATPDRIMRATLVLEDRRFYDHPGVDWRAVLRAGWANVTHRSRQQGASSVAMQVARMQQPGPRSLASKIREAATGLAIVARNGHDATLKHYLRIAPYGNGSHGVAHAARFYFDKPLDDLSWAQAALLAAIPKAPGRMNIAREDGLRLATARARRAIERLTKEGALDEAQAALALRELAAMRPVALKRRPDMLHLALRYEHLVRDGRVRAASPFEPRIDATIDLSVEEHVARLARRYLALFRSAGARQAAVMVTERGANAIVADVGSIGYDDPQAGAFDFTRIVRSPGSTLKPFIYALAFERGALKATDLLADVPEGASGVNNADGQFLGLLTPRQALANSRNVPATNLLRRTGLEANFEFLHELGLHNLETPAESFGVSMAIGALPTRLEDLMRAYAMLADDGVMHDLSFARGQALRAPRRLLSQDSARLITSFLSDPQARLPSFPRYGALEYPFAVAVKTGTSQNYRDAWTLAFSQRFVVGVWMGRGDAGAMRGVGGAASAARLAHAVLDFLHHAKPGEIMTESFAPPPERVSIELCQGGLDVGENTKQFIPNRNDPGALCGQTLREWATPQELGTASPGDLAPARPTEVTTRTISLTIATPEHNMHIWRNPEQPAGLNKLALKLEAGAPDVEIVWMIDGEPFALARSDETIFWPMKSGAHRIVARLSLAPVASKPVTVTID